MLATTLLTFALASCAFAYPSYRTCDISNASIAYPEGASTLPAPINKPSYVAVAIGTQNYTCSAAGTYNLVGAVAELYDTSCLYNTPLFSKVATRAYKAWKSAPASWTPQKAIRLLYPTPAALGQHYFVTNPVTGVGSSPKWDFTSTGATKGNANAYVVAAKNTGLAAPTGAQDIDWVYLKSVAGSLAQEVYRVDTRGGQPPASTN
ncbi:hypothetical protein DXG03_002272 [Asterophora parasitica]|uniref:Malate dehydrogenase n=1 Tax=Asterophora parasitica TaxID=117018 RepID=A0A9P7G8P1_9AGAR|nr:hypothetical protein DXG03_002272 [Asterophora parasitica]